ncbi:MAG: FlgD immunoglobulin-like domain containing protein [Candidatus Eisenbacteria bacterium]
MRRIDHRSGWFGVGLAMTLWGGSAALAATFEPAPISPELGLDVLDRSVTEEHLERALLAAPYAVAALGTVDVYDVFPYVESRFFVVVSDPDWNRIVVTETGSGTLSAFDGSGTEVGPLSRPHGLTVGRDGWLFVCDTENDRVVVLEPHIEYDHLGFIPHASIDGLSRPFDVTVSDAGTPLDPADDRLYVVEAGANRITRFDHDGGRVVAVSSIGGLGTGPGRFAGPTAIAASTLDGVTQIYVAEAHTGAIVRLEDHEDGLQWESRQRVEGGRVTGLNTDRFGNLYLTAPSDGCVRKLDSRLEPLATLRGLQEPKDFFIPAVRTTDHRNGHVDWAGHGTGVLVEKWSRDSGLRLFDLGVDVTDLEAREAGDGLTARFRLTDPADVTMRVLDPTTDGVLAERVVGALGAGDAEVGMTDRDLMQDLPAGDYLVEVTARSEYEGAGRVARSRIEVSLSYGMAGGTLAFAGSHPNPFVGSTEFRLALPANVVGDVEVDVFDPSGRRIRTLSTPAASGSVALRWDGRDQSGHDGGSGVYLYRVRLGDWERSGKVVKLQ